MTLTYDAANRGDGITYPSSATNTFSYNGLGLRVSKSDSSGALAYVCDGTEVASPVLKDGAAVYTPGLSERRGTAAGAGRSAGGKATCGIGGGTGAASFPAGGLAVGDPATPSVRLD